VRTIYMEQLNKELEELERERHDVEKSIKELEAKEKDPNKRRAEEGRKRPREDRERFRERKRERPNASFDHYEPKRSFSRRNGEQETNSNSNASKPKLTSTVVSVNPIPVVGEKPTPSLQVDDHQLKQRNRKMFDVLRGTLQQFKKDISVKTESLSRREELELKVEAKVVEEKDRLLEQHRRLIREKKEKAKILREQIRKKEEEKELQLLTIQWNRHRELLWNFIKTKSKPHIYYLPTKHNETTLALLEASKNDSIEQSTAHNQEIQTKSISASQMDTSQDDNKTRNDSLPKEEEKSQEMQEENLDAKEQEVHQSNNKAIDR